MIFVKKIDLNNDNTPVVKWTERNWQMEAIKNRYLAGWNTSCMKEAQQMKINHIG